MIIVTAINACIEQWKRERAIRAVFGAAVMSRRERKRAERLAMRLLVHHINKGETLVSIDAMCNDEEAAA